jgi:hypothetical protein
MQFVVLTLIWCWDGSSREKCDVKNKNVKKRWLCGPKDDDVLSPEK